MLFNEHQGIENASFLALFGAFYKNTFPVIIVNFCDQDLWEPALNCSQYIVSDTNKHFKFDLDRKLNPWLKFKPNFLTWLPDGK